MIRIATLVVAFLVGSTAQIKTVSVCEVLANLSVYQGKKLAIRGVWIVGPEQNYVQTEHCTQRLFTDELKWPDAIWLAAAEGASPQTVAAAKRIPMNARHKQSGRVIATFVGTLETREKLETILRGDGKRVGNGFGHMNGFPAQLVYDSVMDVSWESRHETEEKK